MLVYYFNLKALIYIIQTELTLPILNLKDINPILKLGRYKINKIEFYFQYLFK
jgi:hypothetical protein